MNNLDDAHELIDTAISTALKESKPAYISIGCNLPGIPHPTFARDPVPFYLAPKYEYSLIISVLSLFGFDAYVTLYMFDGQIFRWDFEVC